MVWRATIRVLKKKNDLNILLQCDGVSKIHVWYREVFSQWPITLTDTRLMKTVMLLSKCLPSEHHEVQRQDTLREILFGRYQ